MKNIDTLIEQYIQGNMSLEEAANFEEQLSQNPDVQAEVSMQKNIIEAIKQTRRLELKTKLMQINPNTVSPVTQKIAIAAATFAVSTLVSIGIYSLSVNNNHQTSAPENKIQIEMVETQGESKNTETIESLEKEELVSNERSESSSGLAPKKSILSPSKKTEENTVSNKTSKIFDPTKPILGSKDENELGNNENLPLEKQNTTHKEETPQIRTNKNYPYLGYEYDGKNIVILGDYKDAYIIEERVGMRVLKYQGKLYKIVASNTPERLENHLVTDPILLEALK